ncbi:MAG: thioredoxin-dependent thiol peroxidase [Bacteroidetes bacterium]|nr:MAG: thioredoxin-dependent thiol peroxidase [Bacteroidota bacterium]
MAELQEGAPAPDFTAQNERGETVRLSDFRGKKLILYFYPKDNTPTCTVEACNLRDHYEELKAQGFEVLGVSPDSARKHQNFIGKHNLPFSLLVDPELKVIKAYGAWGKKKLYGREYEGVLRSTFVIDEEGRIEKIIRKVDAKNHAAQILETLKAG